MYACYHRDSSLKDAAIETIISYFERLTLHLPLELIAALGSFFEEIVSPLPSAIVLVPVGAAASTQGHAVWYLVVLAFCAGAGRLPAALLLYWIANRFEGAVLRRHRFFGVSHTDVRRFGARLGKSGKRDWLLLFLMNGLPVFPTTVLSLACGFIQVPKKLFVSTVFAGSIVNASCYLAIGYIGIRVAETLSGLELAGQIVGVVLFVVAAAWLVRRNSMRRKNKRRAYKKRAA